MKDKDVFEVQKTMAEAWTIVTETFVDSSFNNTGALGWRLPHALPVAGPCAVRQAPGMRLSLRLGVGASPAPRFA